MCIGIAAKRILPILAVFILLALVMLLPSANGLESEEKLLSTEADSGVEALDNPFYSVCVGSEYDGVELSSDYGCSDLTVSIVRDGGRKFVIDLGGNTLTLGQLAVSTDLEIRGEGELKVKDGIVLYAGELHLGDGVRLVTESRTAVFCYGEEARLLVDGDVEISVPKESPAEIAIRKESRRACAVVFSDESRLRGSKVENAVAGKDYYRVVFGEDGGAENTVSSTYVAQFEDGDRAKTAFERGVVKVVNALADSGEDIADENGPDIRTVGNKLIVGKLGAMLSHVTISVDGSMQMSFYFDLAGTDVDASALGGLGYTGLGDGGIKEIPAIDEASGLYRFDFPISAAEMNKTVTVWFVELEGQSWSYSVTRYARYIFDNVAGTSQQVRDMIAAMLNYGAAVQRYNGETEGLADEILSEYPPYNLDALLNFKKSQALRVANGSLIGKGKSWYALGKENSPIAVDGISLSVSDCFGINLHLQEGYSSDERYGYYVVKSGGAQEAPNYDGAIELDAAMIAENGYIELSDIALRSFDRTVRVAIKDKTDNTTVATFDVSVLSYALNLYDSYPEGSAERELAEAVIWYGIAGVACFR